jgi:hypothetical protein
MWIWIRDPESFRSWIRDQDGKKFQSGIRDKHPRSATLLKGSDFMSMLTLKEWFNPTASKGAVFEALHNMIIIF